MQFVGYRAMIWYIYFFYLSNLSDDSSPIFIIYLITLILLRSLYFFLVFRQIYASGPKPGNVHSYEFLDGTGCCRFEPRTVYKTILILKQL